MSGRATPLYLSIVAILTDGAAIFLAVIAAYFVRFSREVTEIIPIVTALPPLGWYTGLGLFFSGLAVANLAAAGYYRIPRRETKIDEFIGTLRRYFVSFTLLLAVLFFLREASYSRLTMASIFLFGAGGLVLSRWINRVLREQLYRRDIYCLRSAVVGDASQAKSMIERLSTHPDYGLKIVGIIENGLFVLDEASELRRLGSIDSAGSIIREYSLDVLVISPSSRYGDPTALLSKACYGMNVELLYLPEAETDKPLPRRIIDVGGQAVWTMKEVNLTGFGGFVKRLVDIAFSATVLVLLLPLFLLISFLVKVTSTGPVFFKQKRVGLDGIEFDCYKFRSMRRDAEAKTGAVWAVENDPRVTSVGRFLRRWSLDELPQFWNVLKGDMSLVGPRPERPEFVRQFAERIEGYHERHRVRAGLTGWAQVNGLRGNVPIEDRTRYDRHYVENWSLGLDFKILVMTVVAVIKGEGSY